MAKHRVMRQLFLLILFISSFSCEKEKYFTEIISYKGDYLNNLRLDTTITELTEKDIIRAFAYSRAFYKSDSLTFYMNELGDFKGKDSMISYSFYNSEGKTIGKLLDKKSYQNAIDLVDERVSSHLDIIKGISERLSLSPEEIYSSKMASVTKESFEKKLSSWDGSLPTLVEHTKTALHNPLSFDHVKTGYIIRKEFIEVKMIYRAENGFGATRKAQITASVNPDGELIEILSSSD